MFALPYVGEGGVLLFGTVSFARGAALLFTTADMVFAIYATVENPEKGPLALLCVLVSKGPRDSWSEWGWREAGAKLKKRVIHPKAKLDVALLGKVGSVFDNGNDKMPSFMPWNQCPSTHTKPSSGSPMAR